MVAGGSPGFWVMSKAYSHAKSRVSALIIAVNVYYNTFFTHYPGDPCWLENIVQAEILSAQLMFSISPVVLLSQGTRQTGDIDRA